MKEDWKKHVVVVMVFMVFIVLGVGSASSDIYETQSHPQQPPQPRQQYDLNDGNLVIHDGVTEIYNKQFNYIRIRTVKIPNSVTSIGSRAFADNPRLTSIIISDSVGSLSEDVFNGSLRNVTRISIGANVNLSGYSDVVWIGFSDAYNINGNRAGTYTLSNGRWSAQFR